MNKNKTSYFQPHLHVAKDHEAQLPRAVRASTYHRARPVRPGRCHQDAVHGHRLSPAQQRHDCRDGLPVRHAGSHVGTPHQDKPIFCAEILHLRAG